jgi:glycosyltransferase involved in cell wall biosynthesis
MTEAFFSLALPIRNGLPGLRRAIEALQRQTYQNFELVVQDGGSTDGSLDYVRQAKLPRIDIVSERDSGIAQAYGCALSRCAGPLVVPLACDEWLDDDALETFASWYSEYPDAAYVYGGARLWKSETEIHSVLHPGSYDLLKFLASEYVPTMAGFFNKKVIGSSFATATPFSMTM